MTVPSGSGDSGGDLPAAIVVCATCIILAIIAGVVYLIHSGKPIDGFITIVAAVALPSITTLLAVRNSRKVSGVAAQAQDIQNKVDGKIDNLITDKSNLEQQVALRGEIPVTARVSFDPDSTGPLARITTDTAPLSAVNAAGKHSPKGVNSG